MATQRQLAHHLDTNEHAVRRLVVENTFAKAAKGQGYDLNVCRVQYIRKLREQAKGAALEEIGDDPAAQIRRMRNQDSLAEEKARLAAEQADKAAMDNAVRRRELVPVATLRDYATTLANYVRAELEALPAQAKREIPHLRSHEINIFKRIVTRVSDAIADYNVNHKGAA